jgi:hypothetical protein
VIQIPETHIVLHHKDFSNALHDGVNRIEYPLGFLVKVVGGVSRFECVIKALYGALDVEEGI